MAKLSARGRTELVRLSKTVEIKEWKDYGGFSEPDCKGEWISYNPPRLRSQVRSSDVVLDREQYALMSDTHILSKLDCTWHDGQKHSYEWKDKGKSKLTVEQFTERLRTKGYEVVRSVKSN